MIRRVEPLAASPRGVGVVLHPHRRDPHRRGAGKMSASTFLRPGWRLAVALSAAGLLAAACGGASRGGNAAGGAPPPAPPPPAPAHRHRGGPRGPPPPPQPPRARTTA